MAQPKCEKPEPSNSVSSQGGKNGVTLKSNCKNCGQPIEKHHGKDAKTKADNQWHHK